MKIVSVTQMRMGSQRLPGKALVEIGNKTVLEIMASRLGKVPSINQVVIATSLNPENDIIEKECLKRNILCFRGSEDDVLNRTYEAAKKFNADIIVQVYGDGPFICPDVVSFMIDQFQAKDVDWLGNSMKTTFPPGQEVEVIKFKALEKANELSAGLPIREHATLFIRQNPDIFKLCSIEASEEWYAPNISLELDEESDLQFLTALSSGFKNSIPYELSKILSYLKENSEVIKINQLVVRRWKEFRKE